ncbi:DUF6138 family protein [Paenibacillus sp. WLX2291]|uniref:DUF6138 family protein n=1 Tax=Paenibacillus sp. WLX2291 TaxID=3296934 RepID=UPI0039845174
MNPHIKQLLDETWTQLEQVYSKEQRRIDEISKHSPLQVGFRDYVRVGYQTGRSGFSGSGQQTGKYFVEIEEPFSWSDTAYTWDSDVDREQLTITSLEQEFMPAFREQLHDLFLSDQYGKRMFDYKLDWQLAFASEQPDEVYVYTETFINPVKLEALKQELQLFIDEKIYADLHHLPNERDLYFFANLMLNKDITPTDVQTLAPLFEYVDLKLFSFRSQYERWQSTSSMALKFWANDIFLQQYFDSDNEYTVDLTLRGEVIAEEVDPDELEMFLYAAMRIGKEDAEQRKLYLQYAVQLHSQRAAMYIKQGSGNVEHERKNEHFSGKANDVLQQIELRLAAEEEAAYSEALTYLCDLLEEGFPHQYKMKFSSKEKHLLPVKSLAKSPLHRFFANALQYPNLYPLLAQYGEKVMEEFAWYEDVEPGEKSVMPGTYAILGLGLYSRDYFPLLSQYMQLVDTEHQSAHNPYAAAFVEAHGLDEQTLPVLLNILLGSGQSAKPVKGLGDQLMQQGTWIPLVAEQLQTLEDYQRESILYLLFGSTSKQNAFLKQAGLAKK